MNFAGHLWIKMAVLGFILSSSIHLLGAFFQTFTLFNPVNWYILSNVVFLLFFSVLFYIAIINPDVILQLKRDKYTNSKLDIRDLKDIYSVLKDYMSMNQVFRNQNLCLEGLAKETGINERSISQTLNTIANQNFFDFVNSYRVNYAKSLLENSDFRDKTMLFILYEAGFNSKTTFNTVFKKNTGMTPSQYQKLKT